MAPLQAGDKFPSDVKFEFVFHNVQYENNAYHVFRWAPITDADPTACGIPQLYDASKEFAGKKVVIVSVPGAFTPVR